MPASGFIQRIGRAQTVVPATVGARLARAAAAAPADLPAILVAVLICIADSGTIVPLFRNFNRSAADMLDLQMTGSDVILALPALVAAALAGLRLAMGGSRGLPLRPTPLRSMVGPAAFLFLAMASCLWTDIPGRTARRMGLLLAAYVAGLFFYKVLSFAEFRRIATISFAVLTAASVTFALALPAIGQEHELDRDFWRGLFERKNNFGTTLLIASCFYASSLIDGRKRLRPLLLILASTFCSYMAGCKTAMVAIPIVVLAAMTLATIRRGFFRAIDLLPVGGVAVVALAGLASMGRIAFNFDASILSLDGRTQLWTVLWEAVTVHPWLGYGYESFWRSQSDWIALSQTQSGWQAAGSHNGYLEALLSMGAVGLLIFLLCLWTMLVRGFKQAIAGSNAAAFAVLVGLALVVQNVTEPFVFRSGALFTALTVYAYLAVTPSRRPELSAVASRAGSRWVPCGR